MKGAWNSLGRGFEWAGVVALVLLSLPILAVTAFLLRAVLIVVAICAVVSCAILYWTYPRFRHWTDRHAGWHQLHLM
jgi:hypothetical protein